MLVGRLIKGSFRLLCPLLKVKSNVWPVLTVSETDRPEVSRAATLQPVALGSVGTVLVVCSVHTIFVGEAIKAALSSTRLRCTVTTEMPVDFNDQLYIVVAAQVFERLPPADRRICYQLEQHVSCWFTDKYMRILCESLCVFDYSIDNINYLISRGISTEALYYVPVHPLDGLRPPLGPKRDIDVLFYGAMNSRRRDLLDALSERFKILIVYDVFGDELRRLLLRASVVLNIHFYEDALLETTRIAESLSHGARIVSEKGCDRWPDRSIQKLVRFAEIGDVDGLSAMIEAALEDAKRSTASSCWRDLSQSPQSMKLLLLRALHGTGALSYEEFVASTAEHRANRTM